MNIPCPGLYGAASRCNSIIIMMKGRTNSMRCSSAFCSCGTPHAADGNMPGRCSRRSLLRSILAAGVFTPGFGAMLAAPDTAHAQTAISPDQALKEMMDGNMRFVQQEMRAYEDDLKLLK